MQTTVPLEAGIHMPVGTQIEWSTNPPVTGMHYPIWAAWDRDYATLERGYYVHNLEHGGIVFLYNCPQDGGCPDVVAQLDDVARGFSTDDACEAPVRNRMVVTADPLLPEGVQVAAAAWGVMYTASCFDPYVLTFARGHYNHAPEDLCNDGANLGGTFLDPAM